MATVTDTFTRADSSVTLGTAPTGQAWSALTGTWGISTNRAFTTSAGASVSCAIEPAFSSIDVTAIVNFGTGGTLPGLLFRVLDDANRLGVFLNIASQTVALFKNDLGTATQLAGFAATLAAGVDYTLRVRAIGTVVEIFFNGSPLGTHTLVGGDATKYVGASFTRVGFRGDTASRFDNLTAIDASAGVVGTPFMRDSLGAGARLAVEAAFGADLTADPASWVFSDLTADLRADAGVRVTVGRADEASVTQPAQCGFVLDNRAGAYSQGAQAANWPNVRRNTPVRVRVDLGGGSGFQTRFFGEAVGWTPKWSAPDGRDATVALTAAGTLRRLQQGNTPVVSAFRRFIQARGNVVGYWPCEDPKGSQSIASGLSGGLPMGIAGTDGRALPDFANDADSFVCSAPLPTIRLTRWSGPIASYVGSGFLDLTFFMAAPSSSMSGTSAVIAALYTTGSITRWTLTYHVGGSLSLQGYNEAGAAVVATPTITFNIDGTKRRCQVRIIQVGGNVDWIMVTSDLGPNTSGVFFGSVTGQTVGIATGVTIGQDRNLDDVVFGHIVVRTNNTSINELTNVLAANANSGELATTRIARLCTENQVPCTVIGTSEITMGPQVVTTLTALLREAEAADLGLLFDGVNPGLTYKARTQRESIGPALTLNAAIGDPAREIVPVDDDQSSVNLAVAERTSGSSATFTDATGPLGTAAIGIYDATVEVNTDQDLDVVDYAAWKVALGTVEGYRYPTVQLDFARTPALAAAWTAAGVATRIDVTNLSTVRSQLPTGTTELLVEGYTETIGQFLWDVTVNTSPYDPWRIGLYATTTGDTSALVLRTTSDGSTLATAHAAGATSLSVATPVGPLWTTAADDLPLKLIVADQALTVTAITGAASPQTFTVTPPLVRAIPIGAAVELDDPAVPSI